jgi:hypothetical protein
MSSKVSKNLLVDLLDVVGAYTDEKTYETLTNYDPETFTKKKLIKNMLDDIPLHDLTVIAKAYKLSKEWEEKREYRPIPENYLDIMSIFIRINKLYGDLNFDKIKKLRISEDSSDPKIRFISIDDLIFRIGDDIIDNIKSNINILDIYENLSDGYKTNFILYAEIIIEKDTEVISKEDDDRIYEQFIDHFANQVKILSSKNSDFHPLSNLEKYKDKLLKDMIESS